MRSTWTRAKASWSVWTRSCCRASFSAELTDAAQPAARADALSPSQLFRYVLAAVLLLLLCETFLAWFFGKVGGPCLGGSHNLLNGLFGDPSPCAGEGVEVSFTHTWPWPPWVTLLFLLVSAAYVVAIYLREAGYRAPRARA